MPTGEQYIASLKDGRKVYFEGKLVEDMASAPALAVPLRALADGYDKYYSAEPDAVNPLTIAPRTAEQSRGCPRRGQPGRLPARLGHAPDRRSLPGAGENRRPDAFITADAARSLRPVDVGDEALAELEVLVGFDDDLAGETTWIGNRIRGLLTGIHPALERAIGPKISHPAVLEILSHCGGPAGIRKAGRRKLTAIATAHAPRMGDRLVTAILAALEEQTVTVPGTRAG
jgi:hypothetical protein